MAGIIGFVVAASIWLVLWAIGWKAVDAALVGITIMLGVAAVVAYAPLLKHSDD